MAATFTPYIRAIARAVVNEQGGELTHLLNPTNREALDAVAKRVQSNPGWNTKRGLEVLLEEVRALLRDQLGPEADSWAPALAAHCQCLSHWVEGRPEDAFTSMNSMVTPFIQVFRKDKNAWLNDPMKSLALNLRRLATAADESLRLQKKKAIHLEECGRTLMQCFAACNLASGNKDKKKAALLVVITMLKVYFKLNMLRLAKPAIRTVNSLQFLSMDQFPMSEQVTYSYYTGRLSIFDEDYEDAEQKLSFAFEHCHRNAGANKAKIGYFLVPVKMLLGELPSLLLIARCQLQLYAPLVHAMKTGDLKMLNDCLTGNQWQFIQDGTYLLLEKLRYPVYRRLLKRVALVHLEQEPAKASQLPLAKFQKALEWQGVAMDLDEVECIVANLIYRKYVKGYISHKSRVLVLSKVDPFPPLATASLADAA